MPYYPRVSAAPGGTFDAIVDAHWEAAIWVSHDHGSAQDAQDAAEATARGLNLRDFACHGNPHDRRQDRRLTRYHRRRHTTWHATCTARLAPTSP